MKEVLLGELVHSAGGRAGSEVDLPVYSVTKHAGFVPSLEYFRKQVFSRDVQSYKLVRPGDFAYATIHLDEGAIGIAPERSLISPMYTVFRARRELVDPSYLLRFLKSPRALTSYERLGKGAVHRRKAISLEALGSLTVPLPTIEEQRRIAAILDQADALRAKRRRSTELLDCLSQSTFDVMFAADESPSSRFSDVCSRLTVGVVVRPASYYVPDGVPALRTLNIKPGRIALDDLVYFSPEDNDGPLRKSRLYCGDLVISRTGKAGVAAVVPPHLDGANAIDLIVATPNRARALPGYLEALINSPRGQRLVAGEARGQIQQHFNVGSLKSAVIPLPELTRQREFVARMECVNAQRDAAKRSLGPLDELFASLQARAFSGQL